MSTLLDIKTTVALNLGKTVSDLTVSGFDLGLVALNQVRRRAELAHDFEFSRKLISLAVNGSTGGNLSASVLKSDGVTTVDIKTVLEVGVFDDDSNLRPIIWTTVAEGLERQRKDNSRVFSSWRAPDQTQVTPNGLYRAEFSGMNVFVWPKDSQNNYTLGMEVYAMQSPWTSADLTGVITVAGSATTAINGSYTNQGVYNGFPLFIKIVSGTDYALWNNGTTWKLSAVVDLAGTPTDFYSLTSTSQSPAGSYSNNGSWTGTVVLTDGVSTSDNWTKYGEEYLTWAAVEHLNTRFKYLVPRTEGNLPPPYALAAQALDAFIEWDTNLYEQFRRHSR